MTDLVKFVDNQDLLKTLDNVERTYYGILNESNYWWEKQHDFIQWIFPTRTVSQHNRLAPILKKEDALVLNQHNLLLGSDRFYRFLRESNALDKFHNTLRVTRVIECLRLVCGKEIARGFLGQVACLDGSRVTQNSKDYWLHALNTGWENDT